MPCLMSLKNIQKGVILIQRFTLSQSRNHQTMEKLICHAPMLQFHSLTDTSTTLNLVGLKMKEISLLW